MRRHPAHSPVPAVLRCRIRRFGAAPCCRHGAHGRKGALAAAAAGNMRGSTDGLREVQIHPTGSERDRCLLLLLLVATQARACCVAVRHKHPDFGCSQLRHCPALPVVWVFGPLSAAGDAHTAGRRLCAASAQPWRPTQHRECLCGGVSAYISRPTVCSCPHTPTSAASAATGRHWPPLAATAADTAPLAASGSCPASAWCSVGPVPVPGVPYVCVCSCRHCSAPSKLNAGVPAEIRPNLPW